MHCRVRWLIGGRLWTAALLALLELLPSLAAAQAPAPAEHTVNLNLLPLQGDTVRYRGVRTFREADGRVTVTTVFTDSAGQTIQRTEGVYEAADLAPVSWQLSDLRSGEEERLAREGEVVRMRYRASAGEAPDEDTVDWEPPMAFTPTVEALIEREWARLAAGETVTFRLLVPSRQDSFAFRLQRADDPAPPAGRVRLRMEPDSWLVRQLVDPLFFLLDADPPHRLREFRGRSSIRTEEGELQDLRIVYAYPDEG